jgi:hypothetical protein
VAHPCQHSTLVGMARTHLCKGVFLLLTCTVVPYSHFSVRVIRQAKCCQQLNNKQRPQRHCPNVTAPFSGIIPSLSQRPALPR